MIHQPNINPTWQEDINQSPTPVFEKGSRLVYGTSGIGGVWGKVDPEESIDCLLYAFENNIMTVDTSPSYNHAEIYLGQALERWSGTKPFISTKVGRLPAEKADECYVDYSPGAMRDSLKRSLDRLHVNQLDLLFLHEPQLVPLDRMEEILDTLQGFQDEGLTNMLGVGGNPTDAFRPWIAGNFQVISGFLKMDATNLSAFEQDIPYIQENQLTYYAASALHMSLLGRKFQEFVEHPPETEWITNLDIKVAQEVNALAEKNRMTLASLAQRYLFSIREADRISMGARTINQIKATVEDWNQGSLPEPLFQEITQTIKKHRY